jgi:uncharacterized membrane protein
VPLALDGHVVNPLVTQRDALTRGPHAGRRDRAEPLANPTRPQEEWVVKHFRDEIRVEAPVQHVWTFLCDTSHLQEWAPRQETSDWTGPYDQVGTTYVTKFRIMGFEMKQTSTVVEVEPLKLIHEHTDDGPMDTYFRFEPEGDATRLVIESDYEMPGYIPGFVQNVMNKNWIERNTRQMLGDFKALAEATAPVPA